MAFGTEPVDSNNIVVSTVYNTEGNTFPAIAGEQGAYLDANSNASSAVLMSFLRPRIVQSAHNVTGSGGKTLTCAFTNNNIAGNSIVVCVGLGEVETGGGSPITLAITDSQSNTYTQSVKATQSTTLEAAIYLATDIKVGANTITVTIAGAGSSNTAIAVEIYEVWGLIGLAGTLDQTSTGNNAGSTSPATSAVTPYAPNEVAFAVISAGGGTITAGTSWTLDSGSLSPTGGNLVSFGAESYLDTTLATITGTATLSSSNAWAVALATFKSVIVPIAGNVIANLTQILGASIPVASSDGVTSTNIPAYVPLLYNVGGASYDRMRSIAGLGDGLTFGPLAAGTYRYNGTNWDAYRGNQDNITVLASGARTTTQTQADQTNYNAKGIVAVLDMTTVGSGSVTLEIDGKDPVSGKYYAILTGAAVTTNSTNIYRVYPGLTASANATANDILPRTWRMKITANNANSATYSVGAMLIV